MNIEEVIVSLVQAAVDSVRPEFFMPSVLRLDGNKLQIRGIPREGYSEALNLDVRSFEHIYVAAVGKAAVGMAEAADRILNGLITRGVVVTKMLPEHCTLDEHYQVIQGGHPVPTKASIAASEAVLSMLDQAGERDLVLFLISGGGSALIAAPWDGISLDTYQEFCSAILGSGADIGEFNTLRKHLDKVKGGRLAQRAAPAKQVTIILSDVVGSPSEVIASGPTVPDPSSFHDALKILERYDGRITVPDEILKTLLRGAAGEIPETLKADSAVFRNSDIFLAADNRVAALAAAEKAVRLGMDVNVPDVNYTGDAAAAGRSLPEKFRDMRGRGITVYGGETTVQLSGNGMGGRNLEMALAAVRPMSAFPNCVFVTLATDGEDGPTDAAGVAVISETLEHALSLGCDPDAYLAEHDSWHFFEKTGGMIKTGSTGTNVNDLTFLIRMK